MTPDDAAAHLRSQRNLRALKTEEEGSPISALPDGIYGFSFSPSFEHTPLFAGKRFRTFEFHKTSEGDVDVVGFATAAEAARVNSDARGFDVHVYPDPWNDATELISIPLARVLHTTQRQARENGSAWTLRVE